MKYFTFSLWNGKLEFNDLLRIPVGEKGSAPNYNS